MHFNKKNLNKSQKAWLARQDNDIFVKKARIDGYRARSAYKLLEIEKKFSFLKNSRKIVDLGSAPGSWSQVARETANKNTKIFAFDLQPMHTIVGVNFFQYDCFKLKNNIINITGDDVDLVISDMAPSSCGDITTDHLSLIELCEQCLEICKIIVKKNGNFICKINQGREINNFMSLCKTMFAKVVFFKPPASRKESREIYIIAQKFLK